MLVGKKGIQEIWVISHSLLRTTKANKPEVFRISSTEGCPAVAEHRHQSEEANKISMVHKAAYLSTHSWQHLESSSKFI